MTTLYKVVETGKFAFSYQYGARPEDKLTYICDRVADIHADANASLYSDGMGSFINVKGGGVPLTVVFRKKEQNIATERPGQTVLYQRIEPRIYTSLDKKDSVTPLATDSVLTENALPEPLIENSIYEWISKLDSSLNAKSFTVFSGINIYAGDSTNPRLLNQNTGDIFLELFELKDALLKSVDIRSNNTTGFSELTFLANSMSPIASKIDFTQLADALSS